MTKIPEVMRALVFDSERLKVELKEDWPTPKITSDEDVIVKVKYCGVCGTDLHVMKGEFKPVANHIPLGHEFSGHVVAVGRGVTTATIGDEVVIDPIAGCGMCGSCRNGRYHHCEDQKGGFHMIGIRQAGGWAEYCKLDQGHVHQISSGLGILEATLCEPLSCVLHGLARIHDRLRADSRVLVCGAGIIGVLWTIVLRHHGVTEVTVTEPEEGRRAIISGLGLPGVKVIPPSSLPEDGGRFDVAVDCSGSGRAMEGAMEQLARGGALLIFSCAPEQMTISVNPFQMYARELTVLGTLLNPNEFPRAQNLLKVLSTSSLAPSKVGLEIFKLDQYERAFAKLGAGAIAKATFEI